MTDSDRELLRMLATEMQELRKSNLQSHVVAGAVGERVDSIAEKLAAQLVAIDERLDRMEHAHAERLDRIERAYAERLTKHSGEIGGAIKRVAAIERGVMWTKAWAAGAGVAMTTLLGALVWAVNNIPPGAWAALERLGK